MSYSIEYFHATVLAEIESWPADILADYARIVELLMEHARICGFRIRVHSGAVCSSSGREVSQASDERSIAFS